MSTLKSAGIPTTSADSFFRSVYSRLLRVLFLAHTLPPLKHTHPAFADVFCNLSPVHASVVLHNDRKKSCISYAVRKLSYTAPMGVYAAGVKQYRTTLAEPMPASSGLRWHTLLNSLRVFCKTAPRRPVGNNLSAFSGTYQVISQGHPLSLMRNPR